MPTAVFELRQEAVVTGTVRIPFVGLCLLQEEWAELRDQAIAQFEEMDVSELDGNWSGTKVARSYVEED